MEPQWYGCDNEHMRLRDELAAKDAELADLQRELSRIAAESAAKDAEIERLRNLVNPLIAECERLRKKIGPSEMVESDYLTDEDLQRLADSAQDYEPFPMEDE